MLTAGSLPCVEGFIAITSFKPHRQPTKTGKGNGQKQRSNLPKVCTASRLVGESRFKFRSDSRVHKPSATSLGPLAVEKCVVNLNLNRESVMGCLTISLKGTAQIPWTKLQAFDRLILTMPDKDIWSQYIVFTMDLHCGFCLKFLFFLQIC